MIDYSKISDKVLWGMLRDIGAVMQERKPKTKTDTKIDEIDFFWLSVASDVSKELDRRMFDGYYDTENDPDDIDDLDDED